jgi:hypothetical protein
VSCLAVFLAMTHTIMRGLTTQGRGSQRLTRTDSTDIVDRLNRSGKPAG